MKVYISVDMEGVGGVTGKYQVWREGAQAVPETRQIVTQEVNAAVEGCLEAGATTIYVNENHSGRDLILSELHPAAEPIVGKPKPLMTLEELDESFTAVFLIGMHAMAGVDCAVLNHTWTQGVYQARVNGVAIGETGLNALMAGHFGVPLTLVAGDDKTVAEAKALLGDVEGVVVKYGLNRYAARCVHPDKVQKEMFEAARRALTERSRFRPFVLEPPLTMEIDWKEAYYALFTALIPDTTRESALTVSFTADDFRQVMNWFVIANQVAISLD